MLSNLRETIQHASKNNCIVPGFNIFGYEDAISVVRAAEEMDAPVLLMTNKFAINFMPVEYWGKILGEIAKDARVPVSIHLDHGKDYETIARAIKSGYSSVMYDGSQLPIEENIKNTKEIVKLAHALDVSVEAEIGSVAYSDVSLEEYKPSFTKPEEAEKFYKETEVDWLAVAVGTVHKMQIQNADIKFDLIGKIKDKANVPLVVHGSTGISDEDLKKLKNCGIGKINIGTALRMEFGNTIRKEMEKNPQEFDRMYFTEKAMVKVKEKAKEKFRLLGF
ncbi:class II fructose-bisphosphate aldolase [Clostridium ganghwense]|uniref:Class II fructose-bisphosphate aldolase n=1 Tax=Clostridium ganghwense TaxID=312089 RepID=A0ABT4CQ09_9CLOT|nr:class II fructose-bisphosphate aldolase [Clostridium ganghwense]MCY6371137.1 class II fructose-bisphosphate aldolase [Clostridium ganghwense]